MLEDSEINILRVESVRVDGNRLLVDFRCEGQVGRFFTTNHFYAEYSTDIGSVPKEILVIPFLATVLPIAWVTHTCIHVNSVDEAFFHSMEHYRDALGKLYPKLNPGGGLVTKQLLSQGSDLQSNNMMLFSTGVDAHATFARHKDENLSLVLIQGGDIRIGDNLAWSEAVQHVAEFAKQNSVSFSTIRSNGVYIADSLLLRRYDDQFVIRGAYETTWSRGRPWFGLTYLGLSAPLAYLEKAGKLYIASSFTSQYPGGWGSHPSIDNCVAWSGTKAIHDGYEVSRQEKLGIISDFVQRSDQRVTIKACLNRSRTRSGNCGRCEKCSRTIVGMELAGLDPNLYGFKVSPETFSHIKNQLIHGSWAFNDDTRFYWEDIKRHAHLKDQIIHAEAKPFLEWLTGTDLSQVQAQWYRKSHAYDFGRKLNPFFMSVPYPLYLYLRKAYFLTNRIFPFFI